MRVAYSGISGRIGGYINEYRSDSSILLDRVVFNWEDPDTYQSLKSYDRIFLSFPVNKINILKLLPELLTVLRNDQTIIKFGSMGPQKVIHDMIDNIIRSKCRIINLQLAPTMQNILDEQIDDGYLFDYRHGRPAPYVSPEDAAMIAVKATEDDVTKDQLNITGPENLTIADVQQQLKKYSDYKIKSIDATDFVNQYILYGEEIVSQIKTQYDLYKTWNPEVSSDLTDNKIYPLTLTKWMEAKYDTN